MVFRKFIIQLIYNKNHDYENNFSIEKPPLQEATEEFPRLFTPGAFFRAERKNLTANCSISGTFQAIPPNLNDFRPEGWSLRPVAIRITYKTFGANSQKPLANQETNVRSMDPPSLSTQEPGTVLHSKEVGSSEKKLSLRNQVDSFSHESLDRELRLSNFLLFEENLPPWVFTFQPVVLEKFLIMVRILPWCVTIAVITVMVTQPIAISQFSVESEPAKIKKFSPILIFCLSIQLVSGQFFSFQKVILTQLLIQCFTKKPSSEQLSLAYKSALELVAFRQTLVKKYLLNVLNYFLLPFWLLPSFSVFDTIVSQILLAIKWQDVMINDLIRLFFLLLGYLFVIPFISKSSLFILEKGIAIFFFSLNTISKERIFYDLSPNSTKLKNGEILEKEIIIKVQQSFETKLEKN